MGSGSHQQQLACGPVAQAHSQQKVQKGWLSRWTRKQWSRHWFVLKNGSITYYRGPAAEICSFLDGVLDLSLIKHIEVSQTPGEHTSVHQSQQQQHNHYQHHSNHHHHFHNQYNQNLSYQVYQSHQYQQQQHQQQHQHQHQQQQRETHYDFTLNMWNGEAHLLSASSAAERQSWLAAINSCTNFEDETATSDSSASSDTSSSCASNLSAKSTDIGTGAAVSSSNSVTSVGAQKIDSNQNCTISAAASNSVDIKLAPPVGSFQMQQQQREAELSIEQLALKLKSAVRRARQLSDESQDEMADALVRPRAGPAGSAQATVRLPTLLARKVARSNDEDAEIGVAANEEDEEDEGDEEEGDNDQDVEQDEDESYEDEENDDKEGSDDNRDEDEDEDEDEDGIDESEGESEVDLGGNGEDGGVEGEGEGEGEERVAVGVEATSEQGRQVDEEELLSIKSYSSASSASSAYSTEGATQTETGESCVKQPTHTLSLDALENEASQKQQQKRARELPPASQRQKKRVTFDLSNQEVSKLSRLDRDLSGGSSPSLSESSGEDGESTCWSLASDEEESMRTHEKRVGTARHSDSSALVGPDAQLEHRPQEVQQVTRSGSDTFGEQERSGSRSSGTGCCDELNCRISCKDVDNGHELYEESSAPRALLDYEQIKRIEARRKLELKRQLSYSKQRENDEDDDSTCELVRRMIERRKLRLLNRTPISLAMDGQEAVTVESSSSVIASSPTGSCEMEISETMSPDNVDDDDGHDVGIRQASRVEMRSDRVEVEIGTNSSVSELESGIISVSTTNIKRDESKEMRDQESSTSNTLEDFKYRRELEHVNQLENRLKNAQFNIDLLERRLSDSYLNYNRLELSYKQLQCQLIECQRLHSSNLLQTQHKIEKLTQELKASEEKLLEAKEKLIKYEEHLVQWQLSGHQRAYSGSNQTTTSGDTNLDNLELIGSCDENQDRASATTCQSKKTSQSLCNQKATSSQLTRTATKTSWMLKNSLVSTNHFHPLSRSSSRHNNNNNIIYNQHKRKPNNNHSSPMNLFDASNHHQPLFLMHHLKQTLSINQQQLGMKLLNQSKQIQRKLNELEIKVDKIQSWSSSGACPTSETCSASHRSLTNIEHIASSASDHSRATSLANTNISSN